MVRRDSAFLVIIMTRLPSSGTAGS
jgi:hypothetical protein